jgi:hypothetical protein
VRTWVVVVVDVEMTPDMVGEVVLPPGRIAFPMNVLPLNATLAPFFASTAEKPSKSAKLHPADAFLSNFEFVQTEYHEAHTCYNQAQDPQHNT